MAVPTLALTFEDLLIRTAEYMAVASYGASGDGVAAVPTDTHDLDRVKRIVNDGWRKFVNAYNWHWMLPTISITFDADGDTDRTVDINPSDFPRASRYWMPVGFMGQIVSDFAYTPSGPRVRMSRCSEQEIRELFSATDGTTGDPFLYAIRPVPDLGQPSADRGRWEMVVYPTPDGNNTVVGRARLYPNKLIELTDRHIAGPEYDEAVLAACLAEAEMQSEDFANQRVKRDAYDAALMNAIRMDTRTAPRTVGYNGNGEGGGGHVRYTGVDSYVSGNGTTYNF